VGRPELPIGTYGKIRTEKFGRGRYRARARFRDQDGKTRDVQATAATGPGAVRVLKAKLRDRNTPTTSDDVTSDIRISGLAALWIEEITAERRLAPQTIHRYHSSLRTTILPALGNLHLHEATVGRLDRFLRSIATDHPSAARTAKVVLGQMLALAVRHDAIRTNPIRDTARLPKPRRTPATLTEQHLHAVRTAIDTWQQPTTNTPGPRHTSDLADTVELMLATGARIGEILALRWEDLQLDATRANLTIRGTLVYTKHEGLFRQDRTKTDAGYRTIALPPFAVGTLLARKVLTSNDNPTDAIFPSRRGTWLSPNNLRRQWRQARAHTGLDWVTRHTFRATVATLIDQQRDTKSAAAQLGHASQQTTHTYYLAKPVLAPDLSTILQQLGPNHADQPPHHDHHRQPRSDSPE